MGTQPKTVAIWALIILFFIVLVQNTQVVTLRFLFWQVSMSQIILLPFVLFIGFIIGFFIGKRSW